MMHAFGLSKWVPLTGEGVVVGVDIALEHILDTLSLSGLWNISVESPIQFSSVVVCIFLISLSLCIIKFSLFFLSLLFTQRRNSSGDVFKILQN